MTQPLSSDELQRIDAWWRAANYLSGSVDPGLLLWLLEQTDMTERKLAEALEHESGLLGLAGSADMREVLAAAERDEPSAVLARDVYVHRLRAGIAAMAAALGGLDTLVFTGGVGERSPEIRARAAAGLAFLGIEIDPEPNAAGAEDITDPGSAARTLVVEAREDLEIARGVRAALTDAQCGGRNTAASACHPPNAAGRMRRSTDPS